jgi:hypothetical protein
VAVEGETGANVDLLGTTSVDVKIATWSGRVVVPEATVGEESGVGNS